ncbi:hypothetical protein PV569_13095 [Streptomyces scabiei]|uniref:hypothetical protein n=1 Tax=Streptomyces scabiei TaxID=1930 RepID=UPI0029BC2CB4|nr:hypothetical protein [Streptomyces scabiei]MDX3294643.1 hypothetical protein [Streptomyces scabiei]
MGLEFGEITRLFLGSEGSGWEPVEGVAGIELSEEDPPVEDTTAFATEYGVRKVASWVPTCPAGVHLQHPDLTCGEHEELSRSFQNYLGHLIAESFAQAAEDVRRFLERQEEQWLAGLRDWQPRGLLASLADPREPTPIERALEILAPHLARISLYQPKARMGHWFPVAAEGRVPSPEQPPPVIASDDRPAWQSPYGPPPRRPR